ncbi:MAG: hypothetical protein WAM66_05565 [Acidobacteriaceae bacterium]
MAEVKEEAVPINIGNINDGAMIEAFDIEFRRALENIADINTPSTATREVTLKLLLKPHDNRVTIDTEFKASSKLAAIETNKSKCFMGKSEDGSLVAFTSDPRQMPLWSPPTPRESQVIKFDSAGVQK